MAAAPRGCAHLDWFEIGATASTRRTRGEHGGKRHRADSGARRRRKFNTGFDRFSGLYLWALFIIVFGIWVPSSS